MMRVFFLVAYGILLVISLSLITWAASKLGASSGESHEGWKAVLSLGSDAFKTILGATIGALASMIAGYLDYKSDKAAVRNDAIKAATGTLTPDQLAAFVKKLEKDD